MKNLDGDGSSAFANVPTVSDSGTPPHNEGIAPVVRRGRPKGSKNKPKIIDVGPSSNGEPPENPKNERVHFLETHKKGVQELHDFATERRFLAQAQPLIDRINAGFDRVDAMGREMLHEVREVGIQLIEWKTGAGHGNWVEFYESCGFHKSIDTARRWMLIAFMTDAQIAEVTSVREAVALLKEEKKRQKKGVGNSGIGMDDDEEGGQSGDTDPIPPAPKPEPEPIDQLELAIVQVCRRYSREEIERMVASMLNEHFPVTLV
jgi:hypothetical protein